MYTRQLGKSGLMVSCIGLGAMPLSVPARRPTEAEAIGVLHHAIDCGITLIDTADSYCLDDSEPGHNERLIGKALAELPASRRDGIVISTKGGLVRPGGRWERDGSPQHLRKVCEASLKNLRLNAIHLYQYHRIDPKYPLAESLGCLEQMRKEGKIRHIGVSNFSVMELEAAEAVVDIVSVQNEYSRQHRQPETDGVLQYAQRRNLAFLAWSPLNGIGGAKALGTFEPLLARIAASHHVSVYQVVLAWLLTRGPQVIPIPGASRTKSIEDSAQAAQLQLKAEELAELNRAAA
ncbi:MAG: aldo/keto reductase [Planctomycetia bacterium]|nr:aldo/keto reductase [Planctomycetia bacterium]